MTTIDIPLRAPALQVAHWFNTPAPLTLESLRGRVVVLHAFQMLCPGCVAHSLPQARRLHRIFPAERLAVAGLHTVFEHHAVMGNPTALQAFIHEYRLTFPIGIDMPDGHGGLPLTMQALRLRGTPSIVVLDRQGRVRLQHFGALDDLPLGVLLGELLAEPWPMVADAAALAQRVAAAPFCETEAGGCDDRGCPVPAARARP